VQRARPRTGEDGEAAGKAHGQEGVLSVGFLESLALVFITLKLIGALDWSWWLVLSPLLAELAVIFVLALVKNKKK
jgi:hypothetical protein